MRPMCAISGCIAFNNVEVKKLVLPDAGRFHDRRPALLPLYREWRSTADNQFRRRQLLLPTNITVPVKLHAGLNVIQFGNPTSYPPDLDPS
jgi:hypothetical protein